MLKIITIILIISSSSSMGIYKSLKYSDRKNLLGEVKEMILHIQREMSYFKEPLPEIILKLKQNSSLEIDTFLSNVLNLINTSSSFETAWTDSCNLVFDKTSLKKKDVEILRKVGTFIGKSDFEGQKAHFALINTELDECLQEALIDIKTKGQMYSKMGISLGLVIAIIII